MRWSGKASQRVRGWAGARNSTAHRRSPRPFGGSAHRGPVNRRSDRSSGRPFSGESRIPPGQVHRTNALLCHPADGRGRNRSPRPDELARCVTWLARRLALVQPSIVVPLGGVALAALDLIEPHGLRLKEAVAIPHRWRGRWLLPLYHLSPRTIARRPMWQHEADWAALGDLWRRVSTLMPEMANAGEQHRDAGTVGRGNDFGVPAASPRLHDG